HKIRKGDLVAVSGERLPQIFAALMMAWNIGAIPMLINPHWKPHHIADVLSRFNPKLFLHLNPFEENISFPHFQLNDENLRHISSKQLPDFRPQINLIDPATILFTSGSTGVPKAVVHQWAQHYFSAEGIVQHFNLTREHSWVASLPIFHTGGLAIFFRCAFFGMTMIVPESIEQWLSSSGPFDHTVYSFVPTQLWRLIQQPDYVEKLRQSKAILLGGSRVPDSLLQECIHLNLPVYTSYGSTEMASTICCTDSSSADNLQTAGKVLPYREICTDDHGEILVRGKTLFAGYLEHDKVVAAVDEKGWFHTGDSGKPDEKGRWIISGRIDNMFISGGENIQPEIIEKVLMQLPEISEAIVVPVEDTEYGHRPVAFISTTAQWDQNLIHKLKSHAEKFLPGLFRPVAYFPFPRNIKNHLKWSRKELTEHAGRLYQHEKDSK
ncbi:MAG: o-succinylbenzoate--CoA ligase, partial [Calditrichaeota bacterium]